MDIKYQLFQKEKLLVQKFYGIFTIEEHINYTRTMMPFIMRSQIEKVLNDMRALIIGDMDYVPGDLSVIIEKVAQFRKNINNNELKNREISLVFWAEDPLPTLISHIFTANFPNKDYSYCTCKQDVMKNLGLPDHMDLDIITRNLNNSFEPIERPI